MRDLAQQNFSQSRERIAVNKSAVRIILIMGTILIILFGLRIVSSGSDFAGGSAISLKDAPKGLKPVEIPKSFDVTEGSLNLVVENASFTNVSGENAIATATRKYGGGSYSLSVSATLPDPKGNVYQVWIVGEGNVILAGDMSGSGKDWGIIFNDANNYSDLDGIWITKEITKQDENPEKHILEGTF